MTDFLYACIIYRERKIQYLGLLLNFILLLYHFLFSNALYYEHIFIIYKWTLFIEWNLQSYWKHIWKLWKYLNTHWKVGWFSWCNLCPVPGLELSLCNLAFHFSFGVTFGAENWETALAVVTLELNQNMKLFCAPNSCLTLKCFLQTHTHTHSSKLPSYIFKNFFL